MADRKPQPGRGQQQGRPPAQQGRGAQPGRGGQPPARGGRPAETRESRLAADVPPPPTGPRPTPRLRIRYDQEVKPALLQEFSYTNVMMAPYVHKVVLNIGLGEALTNPRAMDSAVGDLLAITGQKPVVTKAKKSIAAFKLRAGQEIGCMVTLRGARMWEFFDRLVNVALPRVRDFRGTPAKGFDGRGNYTLGLREQIIFPEVEFDKVEKIVGMNVTVCTTAKTDAEAKALLAHLGMPFRRA